MKHHLCPICHAEWETCAHTDAEVADWRAAHGKKPSLEQRVEELERRMQSLEEARAAWPLMRSFRP